MKKRAMKKHRKHLQHKKNHMDDSQLEKVSGGAEKMVETTMESDISTKRYIGPV